MHSLFVDTAVTAGYGTSTKVRQQKSAPDKHLSAQSCRILCSMVLEDRAINSHKHVQTIRDRDRQSDRQTDKQEGRETDRQAGRQAGRYRQTDRQASTNRKAVRQIDRQADRRAGRQTVKACR